MRKPSRDRRRKRPPEPENENLVRLKDIAARVGLEVREERLTREVGYTVRGGLCRVDEQEVVLLDKTSDPEARIEILCGVLAQRDLEGIFIDPDLRVMIGGAAAAESEAAAGST